MLSYAARRSAAQLCGIEPGLRNRLGKSVGPRQLRRPKDTRLFYRGDALPGPYHICGGHGSTGRATSVSLHFYAVRNRDVGTPDRDTLVLAPSSSIDITEEACDVPMYDGGEFRFVLALLCTQHTRGTPALVRLFGMRPSSSAVQFA